MKRKRQDESETVLTGLPEGVLAQRLNLVKEGRQQRELCRAVTCARHKNCLQTETC